MKISQIQLNNCHSRKQQFSENRANNFSFTAKPNATDKIIDRFLTSKSGQKILKLASINPHLFSLFVATALGTTLRPATILVVPGAKKEDKQYAAGKSIISTSLGFAVQAAIFYPLGKAIETAGKKVQDGAKTKFPHSFKTPEFEAFNYFTNNGLAFIVAIATSAIMAKLVGKIMGKLMPKKNPPQQTGMEFKAQERNKK